jgi:hypothetical protein
VVWVGGTVSEVASDRIELTEPSGSVVALRRLAGGATSFYRVSAGRWRRLPAGSSIGGGSPACVETLMDGTNLLAVRVFLGANCGPA